MSYYSLKKDRDIYICFNYNKDDRKCHRLDEHEINALDYSWIECRKRYEGDEDEDINFDNNIRSYFNEAVISNKMYEKIMKDLIDLCHRDKNIKVNYIKKYITIKYIDNMIDSMIDVQKLYLTPVCGGKCREYDVYDIKMKSYGNYYTYSLNNKFGLYVKMIDSIMKDDKLEKLIKDCQIGIY